MKASVCRIGSVLRAHEEVLAWTSSEVDSTGWLPNESMTIIPAGTLIVIVSQVSIGPKGRSRCVAFSMGRMIVLSYTKMFFEIVR
jgi:hypothetical protein